MSLPALCIFISFPISVHFSSVFKFLIHILDALSAMPDLFFTHYDKDFIYRTILVSLHSTLLQNASNLIFSFCFCLEIISSSIILQISFEILFLRIFRITAPTSCIVIFVYRSHLCWFLIFSFKILYGYMNENFFFFIQCMPTGRWTLDLYSRF